MEKAYRITVFVPTAQLEEVLASITRVLPPINGNYALRRGQLVSLVDWLRLNYSLWCPETMNS